MEEHQKLRKRRAIRVLLTELLMFLSVVLLVVFLTLIVLGYNFNINKIGTEEVIERAGLIQVSSIPSGATVMIDGEEGDLFSRTSFSKTLVIGEHSITLKKDGYDSWSKKVSVEEGLLRRIVYPRLFLKQRTVEEVFTFPETEAEEKPKLSFSKDGKYLELESETEVLRMDLNEGKPVFKEVKPADIESDEKIKLEEETKLKKKIKEIREKLALKETDEVQLDEYLGEDYVVVYTQNETDKNSLEFFSEAGVLNESTEKALFSQEIDFQIQKVSFKGKGQLIVVFGTDFETEEPREMIYDFETGEMSEVEIETGEKWLDEYMKYRILEGGKIFLKDFDGENKRELEVSEKIIKEREVKISANNRYLYYFIQDEDELKLVREKII